MNPYYDTKELGFEILALDENCGYSFNTLIFLSNGRGQIFTAQDSGCSCPIPFDDYEGNTQIEVEQKLERVGSLEQANQIFNTWNKDYDNKPHVNKSESEMEIEKFFKKHFTL